MLHLTDRDRELLRKLFETISIDKLAAIVSGTTKGDWDLVSSKFCIKKSDNNKAVNNALLLFIDGAANLQKGMAGIGGVFYVIEDGKPRNGELFTFSENIGNATNNEAEYSALIRGLEYGKQLKAKSILIKADSELVVKQINGEYKVKNTRLKKLYSKAIKLLAEFDNWKINHIYRDENKFADKLSKEGMFSNSRLERKI